MRVPKTHLRPYSQRKKQATLLLQNSEAIGQEYELSVAGWVWEWMSQRACYRHGEWGTVPHQSAVRASVRKGCGHKCINDLNVDVPVSRAGL